MTGSLRKNPMINEAKVKKLTHYSSHANDKGVVISVCGKQCKANRNMWTTAALVVTCEDCKSTDFWKNREGAWLFRSTRKLKDLDAPVEAIVPEKLLEEKRLTDEGRPRPKFNLNSRDGGRPKKQAFVKSRKFANYLGPKRDTKGNSPGGG